MFRIPRLTAAAAVIGAACSLASVGDAVAATTYTVTTTADTAPGTGAGTACLNGAACSLRQAAEYASGHGGGTIKLSAGTYTVQTNEIYTQGSGAITIQGDTTATTTITGQTGSDSLIREGDGNLTLRDLTVSGDTNLSAWGAIYNQDGSLTLDHVTVTGNTVKAAAGSGSAGAAISAVLDNGTGTNLTIVDSTISGNTALDENGKQTVAAQGGGIFFDGGNNGTLVVSRSTISGNKAGYGGGLFVASAKTALVVNSTLAGNDAPTGAAIAVDGVNSTLADILAVPVDVDLSTIAGNTGGAALFASGLVSPTASTIRIHGSIVGQGATGCATTAGKPIAAAITDRGQNLDAGASCGTAGLTQTDPQLGPLAVTDGPTATMVPRPSSPAIDGGAASQSCTVTGLARPAGATSAGTDDQRFDSTGGATRPLDGDGDGTEKCDIGSVEFYGAVVDAQTATNPTLTGATLAGNVHIGDAPVAAYFQYGVGAALDRKTAPVAVGLATLDNPQSTTISDLGPNVAFSYRLVADDGTHTYVGATKVGRTLPTPLIRGAATSDSITTTTAKLNATIDPNGVAGVQTHFEWGTATTYGTNGPNLPLGSLTSNSPVSQTITGLLPGTRYHWRVVTSGNGATDFGVDHVFTTGSPTPITVTVAKLKKLSLAKAAKKGLAISVTCSSACSLKGHVDVTKAQAKKLKLKKKATTVGTLASPTNTATLKLTKSTVSKLKKGKVKSLTLSLTATPAAVDKLPTTTTVKVTLGK